MKALGIVLAAGEATRHPNKLLLPTREGKLVVESSLMFLHENECEDIVIVVSHDSIVETVLRHRGDCPPRVRYVVQQKANGVVDALNRVAPLCEGSYDAALVTFGDNIYSPDERVNKPSQFTLSDCASVRGHCYEDRRTDESVPWLKDAATRLDAWQGNKWVSRDEPWTQKNSRRFLAGWLWLMPRSLNTPAESLPQFLNIIKASAVERTEGWWDVGTPEQYKEYFKS